jgi:uncharacterized protein (DUF1697 family)
MPPCCVVRRRRATAILAAMKGVRRYAAFLRGVSPMNLKMPALKACLEGAGLTDVQTLLSSGNAVFSARTESEAALERKIEKALHAGVGRTFLTLVRSIDELAAMLDADPFAKHRLAPPEKRVITFLREPPATRLRLPLEVDTARILAMAGREVFSAYAEGPNGAAFMRLLEKTFGTEMTTRSWDTVHKAVRKASRHA